MLHQLLLEQLNATFGDNLNFSPEMVRFIEQVNQSYIQLSNGQLEKNNNAEKLTETAGAIEILQLLDSAQDLFYTTDKNGFFVLNNETCIKITEYPDHELKQLSLFELIEPRFKEEIKYFFDSPESETGNIPYHEFPIVTKSGRMVWLGQHAQGNFDQNGLQGFQVIARDITALKTAQLEAEVSKNFLHEILDAIPSPLFVKNRTHQWVLANAAYLKLVGQPQEQVLGKTEFEFLDKAAAARFTELDEAQFKTQSETVREDINTDENGHEKHLLVKKNIFTSRNSDFLIGVITDITERRAIEQANINLKQFYEQILHKIPTDIAVFDDKHCYLFANEHAISDPEKRNWVIGKDDFDYCKKFGFSETFANERRRLFNEAVKSKKQVEKEEQIIDSKGNIQWILRRMYPVEAANGKVEFVIGFGIDITERKTTEARIIKQQYELEEAHKIARIGAWELQSDLKTMKWSREMYGMLGFETGLDVDFAQFENLFLPTEKSKLEMAFSQAVSQFEPFEFEAELKLNNHLRFVRIKGLPVIENRVVKSIRGIIQDISLEKESLQKLEQYYKELEKKNKELDQFAYVVSHDLKAPLRGIYNLSMWIEEDLDGKLEEDTKNNLELLRKRVKRMEGLIDGILQYSRAGRIKQEVSRFALSDLIPEIIESISPGEHVKFNIQANLPELETEKIWIEQIFSNLISNAVKHNNNPEPEISISHQVKDQYHEFCVADNGPGIDAQFFDKIFVIFQTLQARDTFESTGVGLAIVKKIITEKGGNIWLESEIGHGTRFYFTWPI